MPNRVAEPARRSSVASAIATGLCLVGGMLLLWHFAAYLLQAVAAIQYPFQLDYGEGIVWQQALLIPGDRIYGDITRFPYIVFHYPPVYHMVVRALAATGVDWLIAGRTVSFVSALTVGLLAGKLAALASPAGIGRGPRLTGAAIAGLSVFCYGPVVMWSPLMRVDMLAVALNFIGVACVTTYRGRPGRLMAGALFFLLAMFTKQTALAASLATFPVMLLVDRRRTVAVGCVALVVGLTAVLLLSWRTDGGFLRHILLYNLNRYDFSTLSDAIWSQRDHTLFLMLAVAGSNVCWHRLRPGTTSGQTAWTWSELRTSMTTNVATRLSAIMMLYFAITTAMLPLLGKSGASTNYLIETMCVWSVLIGIFVATLLDKSTRWRGPDRNSAIVTALVGLSLVGQMTLMPTSNYEASINDTAEQKSLRHLQERIRGMPGPVLSDDMVLLLRAGKEVPWEPAIFAELASTGHWDERPLIDMIGTHAFAAIVTTGMLGSPTYDQRFSPAVNSAIQTAYPRAEAIAGRTLRLPPA